MIAALVRHGEYHQPPGVPSAHLPYPLTPRGLDQALGGAATLVALAQREGWRIAPEIHCSRMLRAWQTANGFAQLLGSELQTQFSVLEFSELAERCLGAGANLTVEQIEDVLRADPRYGLPPAGWKRDSAYCAPLQGAESLLDAGKRVADHVMRTLPTGRDEVRVYVGHGGAFRHAAYHLGVLPRPALQKLSMHHARPLVLRKTASTWHLAAGEFPQRARETPAD